MVTEAKKLQTRIAALNNLTRLPLVLLLPVTVFATQLSSEMVIQPHCF
ncbi:hypothetical protein PTUN_a1647 [Pseudoalteromonas tunicata]|nr:hypothetical protein PTUN_a1647 [Pseudoalteromonas tunicata]